MSKVIAGAVEALNAKMSGFDGVARFVIEGEGAIMLDAGGARAADAAASEPADVTMTASRETFEGILDGSVNPTMAFMSGKLKVDGDMGAAMRLGAALS